ncbi:MAG: ABC transporter ATP-binding protein [Syntrophomonadaceae bacterium]|jgi:iron complex transport system ATP-binding protein|nr:ABC transporter ATP-binding protein [Syntrophomonadaceae bacterium]
MAPLLEVREVSFKYPQALILNRISFSIDPGEVFCLLGPNGCGKTTLLDCILGWLKPYEGQVLINGSPISRMSAPQIARQVAYVPQMHQKTFPYLVRDIVLMGRASFIGPFDVPSEEDVAIAEKALDMVGISRLKDRPYTQLSGGEGQLVMVARALAQNSPVIVMDEPTAHLDYGHELVILETVVELVKQTGLAVLMATHVPNHVYYFENQGVKPRAALLKNTQITSLGKPSEVLSEQNLGELYNIRTRIINCALDDGGQLKQIVPISTINTNKGGNSLENI